MAQTKIKSGQFDLSGAPHGNDGQALLSNADGTMRWGDIQVAGPGYTSLDYPGTTTALNAAGGQTLIINGSGYDTNTIVKFGTTTVSAISVLSATQLSVTTPALSNGTYDLVLENAAGGITTQSNIIIYNATPSWTTTAGSLGSVNKNSTASFTVVATEPDGGAITYAITSGALPTGLSLNTSTGAITGTATPSISSNTTYNFTITATDNENQTNARAFSIEVKIPLPSENFEAITYTGNGGTQKIEGGKILRGAQFNGSSSAINLGATNQFASSGVSISMWINPSSVTANQMLIANQNGGSFAEGDLFIGIRTDGYIGYEIGQSASIYEARYATTTQLTANTWHHILITFDSSLGTTIGKIYVNGTLQSTSATYAAAGTFSGDVFIGTLDLQLGKRNIGGNELWYSGKLDQVRIFNKALSSSEITTLYQEDDYNSTTKSITDIFNDGSGVALYEMENNANDTGGASGKYGAAAIFNGSGSYIQVGNPIPNTDTDVAISAWVNLNSGISSNMHITGTGITSSGSEAPFRATLQYQSANTFRIFSLRQVAGTYYLSPNSSLTNVTINPNTWYHIVWSYTASGRLLNTFLNGVQIDTNVSMTTTGGSVNDSTTVIGSFRSTSGPFFNGRIDQLRMYSSTLDSSDATNLYNESSVPTTNLIAHYKFDGDARDEQQLYDGTASNVTYAYDGTASNVTFKEGTKFSPDLVWIKERSNTAWHILTDSIRGANKTIYPNNTYQEESLTNVMNSFDSNGFTVAHNSAYSSVFSNRNGETYVAWCFNAGSGNATSYSASGNALATEVKANTAAGFSIVKYTGNGTSGATINHELGVKPAIAFFKNLNHSSNYNWSVYSDTSVTGATGLLYLNLTEGFTTTSSRFNNTEPTTSVITLGNDATINDNNDPHIAYIFANVDGYQKIGSYTGTGAVGNMIETGFEPAFLLVKNASDPNNEWNIIDNERDTQNPRDTTLWAHSNDSESTASQSGLYDVTFTSNGFSVDNIYNPFNASGKNYIYLAIAADPDVTTPTQANSFDAVTYTGNRNSRSILTGFAPDFVWIKNRDQSDSHMLFDSVRGATKFLHSNATSSEGTSAVSLTSFNSDGFSLGAYDGRTNELVDYVTWAWKAGDHDRKLPTINTTGSINSLVSANQNAGFSVVKYFGNTTAGATVGHGLSAKPELIFIKNLDQSIAWMAYDTNINSVGYLNLTDAFSTSRLSWGFNSTAPNSEVVTLGYNSQAAVNGSDNYIMYCWHSVTGYSKIGSYTGNASSNSVTTGFEPKFVMIKRTNAIGNWNIWDAIRNPSADNDNNNILYPNLSDAELDAGSGRYISFNSNGFTISGDSGDQNANGSTYIYLAIK